MAKGEPSTLIDVFKETGIQVPRSRRTEALEAAADYIKEQILLRSGEGRSSVQGGKWKRSLTPEYRKEKAKESGVTFANLELHGDLLDALDARPESGKVRVEIDDTSQWGKAEGNLLGTYGRGTEHPEQAREFMPHKRGQRLHKDIMEGVAEILRDYAEED